MTGRSGYLRVSEHALCFQLTANGLFSMACSRTPLTCATLSSPAFRWPQNLRPAGHSGHYGPVHCDDCRSLFSPLPAICVHPGILMAIRALPVPVRCPLSVIRTVRYDVRHRPAGLTSLSGRVFALVNDNGTARRESHAFQQLRRPVISSPDSRSSCFRFICEDGQQR